MREFVINKINKALSDLGKPDVAGFSVGTPPSSTMGDFATNVAFLMGGNAMENAVKIVEKLNTDDQFEKVEIAGPGFINIFLKSDNLLTILNEIIEARDNYGSCKYGASKKVALEHTNVNPNKALHIGHLRNSCLGSSCERILEFVGYDVEAQYYVDDTGVQVAVAYLGEKSGLSEEKGRKFDHYAQDLYVKSMDRLDNDGQYKASLDELINQIDSQSGIEVDSVKKFATKVIVSNLETMAKFNIDFDLLVWESDIIREGFWGMAFDSFKNNAQAFSFIEEGKNSGCWVMRNVLDQDKVIVKSNGVVTYTGKDIAYHLWKFNLLGKDFKYCRWKENTRKNCYTTCIDGEKSSCFGRADIVINFIDVRQSFPQQAVNESLKALGHQSQAENLIHVGYGIVFLSLATAEKMGIDISDNKKKYAMSGRKGVGILADDLLRRVNDIIKQQYPESTDVEKIADAAIKYNMLKYNPLSDIVFDLDLALDLHGNSGPYLQYTYSRINGVIQKSNSFGKELVPVSDYENILDEEKELINLVASFEIVVLDAAKELSPSIVCSYLFDLCKKFNSYYSKYPIVSTRDDSATDSFRILLASSIQVVIRNGFRLLNIEPVGKM